MSEKTGVCGVTGATVIVTSYNSKCPCMGCSGGCGDESRKQCPWQNVSDDINPCADADVRRIICAYCRTKEKE